MPYARRLLLKFLMRAVLLALVAPSADNMQPEDPVNQRLLRSLLAVLQRPEEFGGSLFALAASSMTDLIHHNPLSFRTLDEVGLPEAYIKALQVS